MGIYRLREFSKLFSKFATLQLQLGSRVIELQVSVGRVQHRVVHMHVPLSERNFRPIYYRDAFSNSR